MGFVRISDSNLESNYDLKKVGNKIKFHTSNRNYELMSTAEKNDVKAGTITFKRNKYFLKKGTKYEEITSQSDFEEAMKDNSNIYQEQGTETTSCGGCAGDGKITLSNTEYECPRCKGTGILITAVGDEGDGVEITAISVFYPSFEKMQVKYQVTPPGGVTSILVPTEDIVP